MKRAGRAPAAPRSTVEVRAATGRYPVVVGAHLLEELPALLERYAPAARYAVVSDSRVAPLHGRVVTDVLGAGGLRADLLTFPEGEASKNRETWADLTDRLLGVGIGRDACVVAVGGGVTGDLAGFVAATYMRGVPLVQVPTSLVAMIDASVGGKVGVDTGAGKNLVGAFHPPRLVAADVVSLGTLAERERANGLVEALKHGAILDHAYFDDLADAGEALLSADPEALQSTVLRSVELKASVVSGDERESGRRQILNFGHTLGHALEVASEYRLSHGAAVAAGMVLEARLGERMGVTDPGCSMRLESVLGALGFGVGPMREQEPAHVLGYLGSDKKARGGSPRYVLLRRIGETLSEDGWTRAVPDVLVEEVLRDA